MSFASVFSRILPLPVGARPVRRARGGRELLACSALAAAVCVLPGVLSAQNPGTQDPTIANIGLGSTVYALAVEDIDQSERIFVGGDETLETRILLDGSLDSGFEAATFGSGSRIIYTAVPQTITSDADRDKTLVGGFFGKTPKKNGLPGTAPALNIERLNSDGTTDTTFDPGTGANDYVTSIVPEANGSIYVGGNFDHFNKIEHHHVVRLNVDGSLDNTFSSSLDINDSVLSVADQIDAGTGLPNGQILVVGTFNRVNKTNTAKIARLNNDGTLDASFNPVIDTRVTTLAVQPDGKIIIGGGFGLVNGTAVQNLARLNQDGTLDTSFSASVSTNPPQSPDPTAVYVLKLLPDGRLYVGGNFFSVNGITREYFARLLADGTVDASFDPGSAIINSVQSIGVQADNKILIGETVSRKVNNDFPNPLIRLYGDPVIPPRVIPPVVTIIASKPKAKEAGPDGLPKNGQFELSRSGSDLTSALTVYVAEGGTAVSGQDYKPLDLAKFSKQVETVTFQPNVINVKIGVKPMGDTLESSPETVTLTLLGDESGGTGYTLGNPSRAVVKLSNQ